MHRAFVGSAFLAAAGLASVPGFTRITECPCSGDLSQGWIYPPTNTTGPVYHVESGGCWELVSDGCAWDQQYCIELAASCDGTQWNATVGAEPGTVTFIVASTSNAGGLGMCADWNEGLQLLEAYPCYYPAVNKNQEWTEVSMNGIQRYSSGDCLCLDTRSSSQSASMSASASQSPTFGNVATATATSSASASSSGSSSSTSGLQPTATATATSSASASSSGSSSSTNVLQPTATATASTSPEASFIPVTDQRITTCECDGSLAQSWKYPPLNTVGSIRSALTNACWITVLDNCAWAPGACVELRDSAHCLANTATHFNVTAGKNGTVIFVVASDNPPGTRGLCVDFNRDLNLLETYVCYKEENKQQEWIEGPSGSLIEYRYNHCLCPDGRGSASVTPSHTPSQTPTKPPPAPPSSKSSDSGAALGVGLGLGIPLGLLAVGGAAVLIASARSGIPALTLLSRTASGAGRALGFGGGAGKGAGGGGAVSWTAGKAMKAPASSVASAARAQQLGASSGFQEGAGILSARPTYGGVGGGS